MLYLGEFNTLQALRITPHGMFLGEADSDQDVLLPKRYVPKDLNPGDDIDVFLYTDSEDRLIATTKSPKIALHKFAVLKVKDLSKFGAFLDWGLEKDLFLPFSEQKAEVERGDLVTVFLYVDEQTDRLVASAKLRKFTDPDVKVEEGEEVDLLIDRKSDLGYEVIINDLYIGLIFASEVFQPLNRGDRVKGFVKKLREDGKIDLTLRKQGYDEIVDSQTLLLEKLQKNGGTLHLNDKSDPRLITETVQMSKKTFKKSVGALYKQRKIKIESDRITLCDVQS